MTTAAKTLNGPRLWLQALYTVPRVNTAEVDPISRWLVLGRVSVAVMSAISALIGAMLAIRDDGFDTEDSPRVNYGPHPFSGEGQSMREFVLVTVMVLALAAAIGIYLVLASRLCALAFALTGAFLLLFYSGGPFPLKYIGLGEIAVFFIWGPLMIGGTSHVLAEELPTWVLLASVPYGLGVTTVLFGKHLDKLDFDKSKGIRTMPIVLAGLAIQLFANAYIL